MRMKTMPKLGVSVSGLGYGCMRFPEKDGKIDEEKSLSLIDRAYHSGVNYFDTAYVYHRGESELFLRKALGRYPRDSYYVADKLAIWMIKTAADAEAMFADQLKKLDMDHIDFYLLHGMDGERFAFCRELGLYEMFREKQRRGKLRFLGFSFHGTTEELREMVDTYEWDFVQLQLNYFDWDYQDAHTKYEILAERGIPCIVMEPVRGGMLANLGDPVNAVFKAEAPDKSVASWAMRYVGSLPGVYVALSGMTTMEQLEDNLATFNDFAPLDAAGYQTILKALNLYKTIHSIPCTGCRYCMDCPAGVDIPGVFAVYNDYQLVKNGGAFKDRYGKLIESGHDAAQCVKCGACMTRCPQHIEIPARMEQIAAFAEEMCKN